jgi:processive 1,2-diacylglycerol beta-glucosyltransferase
MPSILITHASLGSGHASAALALAEAFERIGNVQVHVEDVLTYVSPVLQKTLSSMYLQTSERGPRLYQAAFEASDKDDLDDAFGFNRIMGVIGSPFIKEYDEMIEAAAPDAIICTMQLPLQLLTYRKQAGRLARPIYVVVTDFMAHSTWFAPDVSGYFVPSPLTRRSMIQRGVPPAHIHITGIPVTLEVTKEKPAAQVRTRHGIAADRPLIALFGGGLDVERVRLIVEQLLESQFPATLAVVAGRNERLEAALEQLSDGPQIRLHKLGMIDFVDDLVAASDLVITKAGGLIVSEVLARGTPMVIIDPILGQEEWNADYIAASGAGIQVRLAEMVPTAALYLLSQQNLFTTMRRQAEQIGRPRAALDIAEHVLRELAAV